MDALQQTLDHELANLPRRFFERLLLKKLRAAGIPATSTLLDKLVTHILSGNNEPFVYKYSKRRTAHLDITDADLNEMTSALDSFCEKQLPTLVHSLADSISKQLLKHLKSSWADEHALQQADFSEFRERMEGRWGAPLGQLRMLLTISREWCQESQNRERRPKTARTLHLEEVLTRLLVRACQVTDEIICLLENGFADGAMARWRTLHEIGVVAAVISQHGESIVKRYVAHQAVESKRAMDKYAKCYKQLGYKPMPERRRREIIKKYDAAIALYGQTFDGDYGWAAEHLKKKRPTFTDLELEAGRAEMRAHYQMGNDNVHAGIKSMFIRLGLLGDYNAALLAGRSNAGLTEPGQSTAYTLTQIAVIVCLSKKLDDLVVAQMMESLRDEIPRAFYRADKKLRRDDKNYKTPLTVGGEP